MKKHPILLIRIVIISIILISFSNNTDKNSFTFEAN